MHLSHKQGLRHVCVCACPWHPWCPVTADAQGFLCFWDCWDGRLEAGCSHSSVATLISLLVLSGVFCVTGRWDVASPCSGALLDLPALGKGLLLGGQSIPRGL